MAVTNGLTVNTEVLVELEYVGNDGDEAVEWALAMAADCVPTAKRFEVTKVVMRPHTKLLVKVYVAYTVTVQAFLPDPEWPYEVGDMVSAPDCGTVRVCGYNRGQRTYQVAYPDGHKGHWAPSELGTAKNEG